MHRGGRWVFELGIYAQPCEQLLFQATSTAPTIATAAAFNPFNYFTHIKQYRLCPPIPELPKKFETAGL